MIQTIQTRATATAKRLYDHTLRPHLPRKVARFNGIPAPAHRLLDRSGDVPDYKDPTLRALRGHVQPSDHVCTVGGGYGVTAVVAAQQATDGQVTVFEGSDNLCHVISDTARRNGVADRVQVTPAVVGVDGEANVWGTAVSRTLSPSALPEADVFDIDVEGAEAEIVPVVASDQRPRVLVVEAHGKEGAPADEMARILRENEYQVTHHGRQTGCSPQTRLLVGQRGD